MFRPAQVLFAVAILLASLTGCASPKAPPPVDPVKEQIIILQKQLLELQNVQNDTRKKVDEQAATISNLAGRLKIAEDRQSAPPPSPQLSQKQASSSASASEKKNVKGKGKKKKPVRRQEP